MNDQVSSQVVNPVHEPVINPTKFCYRCKMKKSIDEFYKNKAKKDGLCDECGICSIELRKEYGIKNEDKVKQYLKKYNFKRKDKRKIYHHQYHLEHKDDPNYKQSAKERSSKFYINNREDCLTRTKKRHKERLKTDLNYKISYDIKWGQRNALKGYWKSGHSIDRLMCSVPEYRKHIESQFLPGMTWENRGRGPGKWQIDHILPISFFNMSDQVEQHMCFRWQNLRPLWWEENQSKAGKIIYHKILTSELC